MRYSEKKITRTEERGRYSAKYDERKLTNSSNNQKFSASKNKTSPIGGIAAFDGDQSLDACDRFLEISTDRLMEEINEVLSVDSDTDAKDAPKGNFFVLNIIRE
jgi:hypothetical protein